jgi:hypothetical protein
MTVLSGASNRQAALTWPEGRCRPCRQGAISRAVAKSAFGGLTCGDAKQQAGLGRPSHRFGVPPAWRALDSSKVRASLEVCPLTLRPLTALATSLQTSISAQVSRVYEDFATALEP